MAKIGHHSHKIFIISNICATLQNYYASSFRPTEIQFKIIFEIVDQNYFKIINKVCNVGSPQVQHAYKNNMCDLFKYILPKDNYNIVTDNNSFLKIQSLDPDTIMKEFKSLMYKHKKLKFKDVHTYYGSMNINDFKDFLLNLLSVSEIESKVELTNAEEFFEI